MEYQFITSFVNNPKSRAFRISNLDNLDNDAQQSSKRSPNNFDPFSHGSNLENPIIASSDETNYQNSQRKGVSSKEPIIISSDEEDDGNKNHYETDEESGLFSPDPINRTSTNSTAEEYFSLFSPDTNNRASANSANDTAEGYFSLEDSENEDDLENALFGSSQTPSKIKTLSNKRKSNSEFQTSRVIANDRTQSEIIPFRYDEVIRSKKERRQLMAVSCPDCSKYFEMTSSTRLPDHVKPVCRHPNKNNDDDNDINNLDTTKNDRIQLLSRHRHRFSRAPTPPGFWTIGFPSLSDEEKRKNELEEYKRRREARKLTEDEWERSRKRRNAYRTRVYGSHISKNYKSSSSSKTTSEIISNSAGIQLQSEFILIPDDEKEISTTNNRSFIILEAIEVPDSDNEKEGDGISL
ncbi:4699_t:CDS:2 [Ambispora leptoticha]|uniref:4699_t:CDS:1 n=1 Tax=Ambispora leptoticha TaxID=144679 RepID=A0A9N9CBJ8_9GLOM|nr:4699_t:CDS:2 [Ambispora leptoticha]